MADDANERDHIIADLGKATASLGFARQGVQGATAKAESIKTEARRLGWDGVVAGMDAVISDLATAHRELGQASDAVEQAATRVGQVSSGMAPGEVTGHLQAANNTIDSGRNAAGRALDALDKAKASVARHLQGAQPEPMIEAIDRVHHDVTDAVKPINSAQDKSEAVIDRGGRLGAVAGGSGN